MSLQIKWIGAAKNNFRAGRGIWKPKAIVIHLMDGTLKGTDAWFNTTGSGVSAHYGIGTLGDIHQYVADQDTAYHAGVIHNPSWPELIKNTNPNYYTLGIEHEGRAGDSFSIMQQSASVLLVKQLAADYSIPLDTLHIIGHHEIYDGHNCPGPGWNKEEYIKALND